MPGFDEDVLDKVRELPEVRAAAPVIEATVATDKSNLLILGVDMLGDRNIRNYDLEGNDDAIDDPLIFLAQPDSLMVTKKFADERGLAVNSKLPMRTMQGDQVFTVRGIMKPGGLASAFGGDLAIMDIYAAQKMFGRGRKFDRIDIALEEGTRLEGATAKLQALLGSGFQVEPPSSRGQQFESTSRMYALASNITSVFALFIGMFIIYNTFAIAVTERRAEIGILRAGSDTRPDPDAVSGGKRDGGAGGNVRRRVVRHRDGARDVGVHRRHAHGDLRSRAEPRRSDAGSMVDRHGGGDGAGHEPGGGGDPGAQRGARGSGEGAAKGRISDAGRRRESRAAPVGDGVRSRFGGGVRLQPFRDHDVRGLRAGDSGGGAALAGAVFLAVAGPASAASGTAAGGRRAGGGQPDSGAAADLGHDCGADAVAGAGDFAGWTWPGRATIRWRSGCASR